MVKARVARTENIRLTKRMVRCRAVRSRDSKKNRREAFTSRRALQFPRGLLRRECCLSVERRSSIDQSSSLNRWSITRPKFLASSLGTAGVIFFCDGYKHQSPATQIAGPTLMLSRGVQQSSGQLNRYGPIVCGWLKGTLAAFCHRYTRESGSTVPKRCTCTEPSASVSQPRVNSFFL